MVKCNLCKRKFSYKGGATTNLRRHLNTEHPTILQKRVAIARSNPLEGRRNISQPTAVSPNQPGPSNEGTSNPGPFNQGFSKPGPSNHGPSNPAPCNQGPSNQGPSFTESSGTILQQDTLSRYIVRPASITRLIN